MEQTIGQAIEGIEPEIEQEIITGQDMPIIKLPDFMKAKTGEGSIEDYLEHPLNFNKSNAIARMIRGATGLLGALDLAIIDIGVGLLEFLKGKKAVEHGNI
jgi:hypothetical protein